MHGGKKNDHNTKNKLYSLWTYVLYLNYIIRNYTEAQDNESGNMEREMGVNTRKITKCNGDINMHYIILGFICISQPLME